MLFFTSRFMSTHQRACLPQAITEHAGSSRADWFDNCMTLLCAEMDVEAMVSKQRHKLAVHCRICVKHSNPDGGWLPPFLSAATMCQIENSCFFVIPTTCPSSVAVGHNIANYNANCNTASTSCAGICALIMTTYKSVVSGGSTAHINICKKQVKNIQGANVRCLQVFL